MHLLNTTRCTAKPIYQKKTNKPNHLVPKIIRKIARSRGPRRKLSHVVRARGHRRGRLRKQALLLGKKKGSERKFDRCVVGTARRANNFEINPPPARTIFSFREREREE